jgi:chromate transporter
VSILVLAGGVGLLLFHSRRLGVGVLVLGAALLGLLQYAAPRSVPVVAAPVDGVPSAGLAAVAAFLLKVGAFTFGGGLTMIAFIQEQVVDQFHWLTPQEFIDGLALGQFTPGPILMVAAYVGYKVAGIAGAVAGAVAAFVPSFVLMLAILPAFDRVRRLAWTRAAMRGVGPAVIGVLAVSLLQLAPHALLDGFAIATLIATVLAILFWRVGTVKLIVAASALGILRSRLGSLRTVKAALCGSLGIGG